MKEWKLYTDVQNVIVCLKMNKLNLLRQRNEVKQLIEMSNRTRNVLKWGSNETDNHIQMKLEICKHLKKIGEEFYCEAKFIKGMGRADILNVDKKIIYEIVESESEKSKIEKTHKYPYPVIFINANQEFKKELIQ